MSINSWSALIENHLKLLADHCIGYKWMHSMSSEYYNSVNSKLNYMAITVGPISAMLQIINTVLKQYTDQSYIAIDVIAIVISFLSGILIAIINFSALDEYVRSHQLFSSKYNVLFQNINRQLNMDPLLRENANDYTTWVQKNENDLFEMAPSIPDTILKKYRQKAIKTNFPVPGEDLEQVVIKRDETGRQSPEMNDLIIKNKMIDPYKNYRIECIPISKE